MTLSERIAAHRYTRASLDNLRRKRASGAVIEREGAMRLLMRNAREIAPDAAPGDRRRACHSILSTLLAE